MKNKLSIFLSAISMIAIISFYACNSDRGKTNSDKDSISTETNDSSEESGFKDLEKKMDEMSKADSLKKENK
jgi:hypothetical protein